MQPPAVRVFVYLLTCSLCLLVGGCTPREAPLYKISGATMGTLYHITIVNPPAAVERARFADQIDEILEQVNAAMSTYRQDSELTAFNHNSSTDWVPVSAATRFTVAAALEISVMTGGVFDVTVAPLVDSWGFGHEPRTGQLPNKDQIEKTLTSVGYQMLHTRISPPALRKDHPSLSVDLSAIAKGYAVDLIAERLETLAVNDYLVEIGGEIRVAGRNARGQAWRVAVERPLASERGLQAILTINQGAMATSGDYRNFQEIDGRRFSHAIDPQTGQPVVHNLASVTVVAESTMIADALATALLVMGPELAYEFAIENQLAAFFVIRKGDHSIERSTPELAQYRLEPAPEADR